MKDKKQEKKIGKPAKLEAQKGGKKFKQKTNEEIIIESQLENIENERLKAVFQKLSRYALSKKLDQKGLDKEEKDKEGKGKSREHQREKEKGEKGQKGEKDKEKEAKAEAKDFGYLQLQMLLTDLKYPWTKHQIERMIWEVDENLDERVDFYEFELMYKRCVSDQTGLEPRNLFNLAQFLMYDKTNRGTITVEDTLELIYVRYGEALNEMIKEIFDNQETTEDGLQREFTFQQYLTRIRKRDLGIRKALEQKRREVSEPIKKEPK